MKSQDLIEDSSKIPKGRKINRDFHFIRVFFQNKRKKTPCGCNFLIYRPFEVAQSTKGSLASILVSCRLFLLFGQKIR